MVNRSGSNINQWHRGVPKSLRWPAVMGLTVLFVCGLGFGVWAGFAPIKGAVVASGSFVATGQNKQIQHLEGGIVRSVLVREGDIVEADAPLLRLDDTAARATLRRLELRRYRLIAMRARLEAQIRGSGALAMPREFARHADDDEVLHIFERQKIELAAHQAKLATDRAVLEKEIAGVHESISGYQAQVKSTREQLRLFGEELKAKRKLLKRQLIRKSEILGLQRAKAQLLGQLGELLGRIADAKERIARAEQQIAQIHSNAVERGVKELRETEGELDDIREQIRAAKDVVERAEVRAPVRGIVVKLNYHTRGGVVTPGAVLLELLPLNDELIIEARIDPSDVTNVAKGQAALVRLSALNQRITPMIKGRVSYLSADTVGEVTGAGSQAQARGASYIVRVRLDKEDARQKADGFRPTPGMPADVFIQTGERTFLEYLMRPVVDSFSRAFKEQ